MERAAGNDETVVWTNCETRSLTHSWAFTFVRSPCCAVQPERSRKWDRGDVWEGEKERKSWKEKNYTGFEHLFIKDSDKLFSFYSVFLSGGRSQSELCLWISVNMKANISHYCPSPELEHYRWQLPQCPTNIKFTRIQPECYPTCFSVISLCSCNQMVLQAQSNPWTLIFMTTSHNTF